MDTLPGLKLYFTTGTGADMIHRDGNYRLSACSGQVKMESDK